MNKTNAFMGVTAAVLLFLLPGCGVDAREAAQAAATEARDEHGHDHSEDDAHDHSEERAGATAQPADEHGAEEHGAEEHGPDEHGDEDEHGHGHDDHEEGEPDFAAMTALQAEAGGIVLASASTGTVDTGLLLTGNLIIDPKRLAQVRGRFAGLVRSMHKEVGDPVVKGEVLASVESNESLTVYNVAAPIAGVVLERHVSAGDVSGDGPLYTVGDTGALQAELLVFPSSAMAIRRGAVASIIIGDTEVAGTITTILPGLDPRTQARRVRVTLDGAVPPGLAAGLFVSARIVAATAPGTVVVPLQAVKQLEGRDVVFVPGESGGKPGFRVRPVVLGERGRLRVAIRSGLAEGERYVSTNAFLVKAEIGKNMAAHEH